MKSVASNSAIAVTSCVEPSLARCLVNVIADATRSIDRCRAIGVPHAALVAATSSVAAAVESFLRGARTNESNAILRARLADAESALAPLKELATEGASKSIAPTVLSLTPALPGWRAYIRDEQNLESWSQSVAAWALCERRETDGTLRRFIAPIISPGVTGADLGPVVADDVPVAGPGYRFEYDDQLHDWTMCEDEPARRA